MRILVTGATGLLGKTLCPMLDKEGWQYWACNSKIFDVTNTKTDGQRVAAVVARAENATLQNIEVISGSVKGPKQMGAIVAIALGGVTLDHCVNNASVEGNGASVGGLVGHLQDTSITITNSVNNG